jgi:anti-sigma factor RsiW
MSIDCTAAEALIARRVDGEIDAAGDRVLDAHLAGCPACAAQLAAELAIDRRLAATFGRVEAPPSLTAAVRRRVETEPVPAASRAPWLADALNAGGLIVVGLAALSIAPLLSVGGVVLAAAAVAAACYPLVLSGLAGDAGPGDPGPAQPARQH